MRTDKNIVRLLLTLRTMFCLSFAILFLTETFIPMILAQAHDPIELTENSEEGEEKKEKEKEVFDTDEIFAHSSVDNNEMSSKLFSAFVQFNFINNSVTDIYTPPPDFS